MLSLERQMSFSINILLCLQLSISKHYTHFFSVHQTEKSTWTSGEKPGDGKKADYVLQEDAEQLLLTSDKSATAADTPPTLPTAETEHGVHLRQTSIAVLNDLLAIDPSIPSSTESQFSTGRVPTVIMCKSL